MKIKMMGGLAAAVAAMAIVPAAQAFTVESEGFEAPAAVVTSSTTPGGANFFRVCAPAAAHSGSCGAVAGPLPAFVSSTFLTQNTPATGGLSGSYQLSFWQKRNLESTFDGMVLETSINGGPFIDYTLRPGAGPVLNGYNATISSSFSNPIGGRQAWSGNSGGYVHTVVNLGNQIFKGQNIRYRFRIGTDTSVSSAGVAIDDIMLTTDPNTPGPTPPPPSGK